MERWDRSELCTCVTSGRRNGRWVASWVCRRCSCWDIQLRQAVKRLVRKSVLRPIFAQRTEIVVKRTILLCQEDDVIQRLQRSVESSGCRLGRVNRQFARIARARTCSRPARKRKTCCRSSRQCHLSSLWEVPATTLRAINPGGITGHGSGTVAGQRNRQLLQRRTCE